MAILDYKTAKMEILEKLDQFAWTDTNIKRRIAMSLIAWIIFLALIGVDYLVSWKASVRQQHESENVLNALQLPAGTVQDGYLSGHKTHNGSASRLLLSTENTQNVCEFFKTELSAAGWVIVKDNCSESAHDVEKYSDGSFGHTLLQTSRASLTCIVTYRGRVSNQRNRYVLNVGWGK